MSNAPLYRVYEDPCLGRKRQWADLAEHIQRAVEDWLAAVLGLGDLAEIDTGRTPSGEGR